MSPVEFFVCRFFAKGFCWIFLFVLEKKNKQMQNEAKRELWIFVGLLVLVEEQVLKERVYFDEFAVEWRLRKKHQAREKCNNDAI